MLTTTTVLCVSLSFTCGQKDPSYTYGDKANLIQALPDSRHKASPGPPHIPCHQIMLMTENYLILLRVPQCISSLAVGGKPTKTTPCVMCSLPFLWYIRSFLNQLTSESLAVEVFLKPVYTGEEELYRAVMVMAVCQRKYMQKGVPKIYLISGVGKQNQCRRNLSGCYCY